MGYELYTLPNCEDCSKVKKDLKEKNVDCEEVSLAKHEKRIRFNKIYQQSRDSIRRDNGGAIILPVLVESDDSEIIRIIQGEEIKELF